MHLYMSGSVVIFYPTRLFWTKFTKMIHSSGVLESNLGILITYFPEALSSGVLWHIWSIYSKASSLSFSGLARGMIPICLGEFSFFWKFVPQFSPFLFFLLNLSICREVTLLCPMLKIYWRKTLIVLTLTWRSVIVGVFGGSCGYLLWTCACVLWADIKINFYKLISTSTTYYTTTITT